MTHASNAPITALSAGLPGSMAGFSPGTATPPPFREGKLSLGLQGGGSFGAFTWGVLDRLLEQDGLAWDTISGASAGAVNAVVLADGLAAGGPATARRKLAWFWQEVSRRTPSGAAMLAVAALGASLRWVTPFALDPPRLNPLRDLLAETVDFPRLRAAAAAGSGPRLLLAATRVRDGRPVLFGTPQVRLEAVLASACLPFLGEPVVIDGEACWDGGFSANPPLRALVEASTAADLLLVRLLPAEHDRVPHHSHEIARRLQELTFNAPLLREEDEVAALRRACGERRLFRPALCRKLERLRLHRIAAPDAVAGLERESPLDTGWPLLQRLKDAGRAAAEVWLAGGE
ncbi:MAG: patatin-like phospholipase family protein [Rhodospirillales bacterium]|nr:patatin-like phospholipase family protein [Rhodospirillales bacterium]